MASGVNSRLVNKKPKGVMLPKGTPAAGRTNATNPSSLTKLQQAYSEKKDADATPLPKKPMMPIKREPQIEQKFKDMGEAMGICPYELKEILNANIDADQTLLFTLLKKFVSAVKLSGGVDLTPTHKMLKQVEESYKVQKENWERSCEDTDKRSREIMREVATKDQAFVTAWSEILIDLQTKLERNNDVTSLGEWDRLMTLAIAAQGDEYCSFEGNLAVLSFKKCQTLPADTVIDLPRLAGEIQKEEENARWQYWLSRASVDTMLKKLWEFGPENDGGEQGERREQLEWAIVAKSGRIPVRDRWGNLDWHRTFRDSDEVDVEEWDYEEKLRHDYHKRAFIAKLNSNSQRVKSGSGKKSKV